MFEQSIVATQPANKTWTLGLSILVQISLISAAILFPLVYTDTLPLLTKLVGGLVAPLPPPKPPDLAARPVSRSSVTDHAVTAPFKPPTTIYRGPVETQTIEDPGLVVSGGIETGTGENPLNRVLATTNTVPHVRPPEETVKPPVETRAPMRVSGTVQEAKLLRKIIPIYPPLAIAARVQGSVHLVGVISKDGTIRDLQVIDGSPMLIRAALDAVRQWVYRPTLLTGEPVEVIAPITVTFTLNR